MDELSQLEEELYRDDSTSCTSSLATTVSVSEDPDELHLGAEANSFDFGFTRREEPSQQPSQPPFSPEDCCSRRNSSQCGLIVMKELYSSCDSNDTFKAFSSITNVVDLLQARECDPGEMLACLGFASSSEDHKKREILSRFKPSPLVKEEDNNRLLDNSSPNNRNEETDNQASEPHVNESISKAKEWLALHHNEQSVNPSGYGDRNKMPISDQSALASIKRPMLPRTNKLRRRFSKSRQSSFELLLPNLKEEESPEGDNLTVNNVNGAEAGPYSPIRESSMERVNSVAQSPFEKQALNEEQNTVQVDLQHCQVGVFSNHSNIEQLSQDLNRRLKEELRLDTVAPTKPPKNALVLSHQLESFEMEEINSCNEDSTDFSKQRRFGVVSLLGDDSKQPQDSRPNSPGSPASNHGSDDNESSSGFGEEDAGNVASVSNFETTVAEDACQKVEPHTVVQSIEAKFCHKKAVTVLPSSTRYVYDVPLGDTYLSKEASRSGSPSMTNYNDNNNGLKETCKRPLSQIRSNSFGALPTQYIPLRYETTKQGAGRPSNTRFVIPVDEDPATCSTESVGHTGPGKCRHVMSDLRRRRKEFANRCAVSGDSFDELCRSSSLVRHNGGGFAVRKRRPGCFLYYKSTGDLFDRQQNSQPRCSNKKSFQKDDSQAPAVESPDLNSETSEKGTKSTNTNLTETFLTSFSSDETTLKVASSSEATHHNPSYSVGTEPLLTNGNPVCLSDNSSGINNYNGMSQTNAGSNRNTNNNSNSSCRDKLIEAEHRKKMSRQRSVATSNSRQTANSLPLSNSHCGQCYG